MEIYETAGGKIAVDDISNSQDSIHYIPPYRDPVRSKGINNEALIFDGFSNFIPCPADKFVIPAKAITISVWVAPRAFEHGDSGKLSAIVNQQNLKEKTGFALGIFRHGKWLFQVGTGDKLLEGVGRRISYTKTYPQIKF